MRGFGIREESGVPILNLKQLIIAIITSLFLSFLFSLSSNAHSQIITTTQSTIDSYIQQQMQSLEIPGVALAVVHGDQIYTQGYGIANADGQVMTPQTPFLIASISKPITALAVMQLLEADKIDLDQPVHSYLSWFQVKDPDVSNQIMVRHLLHQTSGFSEREGYLRNIKIDHSNNALEQSIYSLSTSTLNNPPGETFEYSNTNFDVLGLLIQTISGQSYEDYIQTQIFDPLEMQNSHTYLEQARDNRLASGYTSFFGSLLVIDRILPYSRITKPSAGLFSSAEDLSHFMLAHLNQGMYGGKSLISPAGVEALFTPGPEIGDQVYYNLGWVQFPFTDAAPAFKNNHIPTAISHSGDWIGYKSVLLLLPENDLGVVVLMNKSDPIQPSAFFNLGWNVTLIALGVDPVDYPPAENFIARNLRIVLAGLIILLLVELFCTSRFLSNLQYSHQHKSFKRMIALSISFGFIDIILAGYLLLIRLLESQSSLLLTLHFEPDIGLMYSVILILTIGWGVIRSIWVIRKSTNKITAVESNLAFNPSHPEG